MDAFMRILGYIIAFGIIVLPIYLIIKKTKSGKKEVKVKKEGQLVANHIEGISYLREDQYCKLYVDSEKLTIVADSNKQFNILLEQIVNVGILTKKEVEMKNKSVVGRSMVGSVFGLGLLGAMSGIGQKAKKKNKFFLVINYKSKGSEEVKILSFGLFTKGIIENRFEKVLKSKIQDIDVNVSL